MKQLTLVRHAQAEPALAGQSDFDRVLTRRGTEDAAELARRLKQRKLQVDHILTSSAARALATAEIFARVLKLPHDAIETDDRLYTAGPIQFLKTLHECGAAHRHILLASHNPGIAEFADKLADDRRIEAMPTCSVVTMQFTIADWTKLEWHSGLDVEFDYPGRMS